MESISWGFEGAEAVDGAPPLSRNLAPGQVFADRYRIEAALGRGAMGAVYRARDLQLGRDVAIKIALDALDESRRARFLREGQVTAGLAHPAIVRLHSGGLTEDGLPFLVLELIEGARTLEELLPGLSRDRALDLFLEVCDAVGHAHARGVVHRDLKPENVLVDAEGRARVVDFGLGWLRSGERLTRTGGLVGTPAFASPEQIVRGEEDPRPESDVWSLGVFLYEVLTGQLPFPARTFVELLAQIEAATPASIRQAASDVPRELEAVVLRALARAPERRYPDAAALAEALRAARRERPRGRSWLFLGVALLGVALLGGSLLALAPHVVSGGGPSPAAGTAQLTSRPPSPGPRAGDADLAALEIGKVAERRTKAEAWLERFPDHPQREAVTRTLEGLRGLRPRRRLAFEARDERIATAFHGDRLWTSSLEGVRCWDVASGALLPHASQVESRGHRRGRFLSVSEGVAWVSGRGSCWLYPKLAPYPDPVLAAADEQIVFVGRSGGVDYLVTPRGVQALGAARPFLALPEGLAVVEVGGSVQGSPVAILAGSADPVAPLHFYVPFDPQAWTLGKPVSLRALSCSIAASGPETFVVGTELGHLLLFDHQGVERGRFERSAKGVESPFSTRPAHPRRPHEVRYEPQADLLLSVSRGKRAEGEPDPNLVVAWDFSSRKELRAWRWKEIRPFGARLSPDGETLAIDFTDGWVELWTPPRTQR